MACRILAKKSCSSHLFGVVPSRYAQTAFAPELSKAITFFVLSPILVKFHIRTHLIESFPTNFRTLWCAEEKLHFTPFHTISHLTPTEAWRRAFPPLGRVAEFRARYRQMIPVRGFWGVGKIWRPCDLWSRSYKRLYTHGHMHTHTHTQRHAHRAINIMYRWYI